MANDRATRLGRHHVMSIAGMKRPPADPRKVLASTLEWLDPQVTTNVDEYVAGMEVSSGQAVILLPSGQVAPADSQELDQLGKYAGVALSSAAVGGVVYAQLFGLCTTTTAFIPGRAIYIGQDGLLTHQAPTTGYRLCVGTCVSALSILLRPDVPIVCAASSDSLPWSTGQNGGTAEEDWATLQDLRDGVRSRAHVAPDVLHAYIDEVVDGVGLSPDDITTSIQDVINGTDKLVTANILRLYVRQVTPNVAFATTTEIEQGTVSGKAIDPAALSPILSNLRDSIVPIEFASVAEVMAGGVNDKAVSPFTLLSVRNDIANTIQDVVDRVDSIQSIPRATWAQVSAGLNIDAYVAPSELAQYVAQYASGGTTVIPWATDAEFLAGTTGRVATTRQILDYGGSGSGDPALIQRVTEIETWISDVAPILATPEEVEAGITDPRKVPSVKDMIEYLLNHGGGGSVEGIASLEELIKGDDNTKVPSVAGLAFMLRQASLLRTDANGVYYIEGMTD